MLKNYFEIEEDEIVKTFLKSFNEKKNMQYIILNTNPKSFVDLRTIAVKAHHPNEKLKGLKKPLAYIDSKDSKDFLNFLIESGERVIQTPIGYFDFLNGIYEILEGDYDFLNQSIETFLNDKREVFALNEDDLVSVARSIFLKKRINLLPVIKDYKVVGELRTFDLLVLDFFDKKSEKGNFYDKNKENSLYNIEVSNFVNYKPLLIDKTAKIKDALEIMNKKSLPSLIVLDGEELFSVISYKDIFRLIKKDLFKKKFDIEYVSGQDLYEDEFDLIQDYCEKTMRKISKILEYEKLKLVFKVHGNTIGSHQRKASVKISLSKGNHVLNVDKEIVSGVSTDEENSKVKGTWNIPLMVQEALFVLEKKVKEEKGKK